jgi:hypothetical protein
MTFWERPTPALTDRSVLGQASLLYMAAGRAVHRCEPTSLGQGDIEVLCFIPLPAVVPTSSRVGQRVARSLPESSPAEGTGFRFGNPYKANSTRTNLPALL